MMHSKVLMIMMLLIAAPMAISAEPQRPAETASALLVAETATAPFAGREAPCVQSETHMRHKGHGQGHGHQGKGGGKHGAGHKGKGHHDNHDQVARRLDMIEARLAKIEAMLEAVLRR